MSELHISEYLRKAVAAHHEWKERWHPFEDDETLHVETARFERTLEEYFERLGNNYPFFHPSYAGQMLKPPHPAAIVAYFAAMLVNPNNHALDGGPATGQMEKEVVSDIAEMFGFDSFLGHLTSSGTIANLEALWISRELSPGKTIAFSGQSHYTHRRMCQVLDVPSIEIPADRYGKMDPDALRSLCLSEDIGTVVATIGTTGLGALDFLPALLDLRDEFGFRLHADAAYGGFFTLIADDRSDGVDRKIFSKLAMCDSIVVDPHKHGLQPYGCGCILFRDPSVGRFYKHDSPYTYFTSSDLHLGEISLECSRPGAAAGALWFTLRCLPLESDNGLGPIVRKCRRAARRWSDMIRTSQRLFLLLEPELDIVTFFHGSESGSSRDISENSEELFNHLMFDASDPVYLSTLRVPTSLITARYPGIERNGEWTTVLRSSLMKPEHADHVKGIHERIESAVNDILFNAGGIRS